MAVIEDLKNEIYSLDSSQWSVCLCNILRLLSFPVSLDYTCNREQFIFEYSGKLSSMSARDRSVFSDCLEIAEYKMDRRYCKIRMFGVVLSGNPKTRNEKVYDIYKVLVKMYGRLTILSVVFNGQICFVGLNVDHDKHAEVVISDWIGFYDENEKFEKLLEVDFSLFDRTHLGHLYSDYVWAISRDYVRYPESKMYLIYGCDHSVTHEVYIEIPFSNEPVLTTRVDIEETLKLNTIVFSELYGWDYFIDDSNIEVEEMDFGLDEDDIDFKWTMLEMELASEDEEESVDDECYDDFVEYDEYNEEDEGLIGLNPEEMLDYIRNR